MPAAAQASGPAFVDWVAVTPGITNGTLLGRDVTMTGPNATASYVDGSYTGFATASFTPALPRSDTAYVEAPAGGAAFTIALGGPVQDPVLDLASLGSTLTFPAGTAIGRVSGSPRFAVAGNAVVGVYDGADAEGTVRLPGVYSQLRFTARPTDPGAVKDGVYLQLGGTLPPVAGTQPPAGGGPAQPGPAALPPLRHVRNLVANGWSWTARRTRPRELTVQRPRAGTTVRVRCAGGGCAFRTRTIAVARTRRALPLVGLFEHRWLKPGAKVTIVIARPGLIARVVEYRMRRDRRPALRKRCLPPGAAQPARC